MVLNIITNLFSNQPIRHPRSEARGMLRVDTAFDKLSVLSLSMEAAPTPYLKIGGWRRRTYQFPIPFTVS
jgi:hypothetical protein